MRGLLAFACRQVLQPQAIDLNEIVARMMPVLRRTLGEPIEIATLSGPDLWPALADPGQVEAALLNLVLNARDAMPGGGQLSIETASVHVDEADAAREAELTPGDYCLLAVTDAGAGMSEETKIHALEPFFTTKTTGKGSGLGLSMVYGFAKQSGGHVKIDSERGQGTTVKLYLPRAKGAPASTAPEEYPCLWSNCPWHTCGDWRPSWWSRMMRTCGRSPSPTCPSLSRAGGRRGPGGPGPLGGR